MLLIFPVMPSLSLSSSKTLAPPTATRSALDKDHIVNTSLNSCVFINPNIPELQEYKTRFSGPNYAPKFIPSSGQSTSSSVTETSNIINIGNRILQDADENKDSMFTCRAKITKIITREGWYYFGCPICRVKLQMGSDSVFNKCPNHGEQAGKPMYKMQIRLEDEDDSTLAMLIGKPAEILFRKPCSQLIDEGSTEKTVIPKIILDTMHIYKIWKIGFGTRKDFMVRGVYPDTEKVGQEIEEPKTSGKLPLKRKSWSPKESTLHQLLESAKKTKREAGGSSKDTVKPD